MQSHENTFDVILSWALVIFLDAIPWETPNPQRYGNTSYGLELKAQLTISYHATRSHVVHKLCLSVDQLEFNLSSLSWSTFIFTLWSSGDMNILRLVEENDIPFWIIIIQGRIQHMWPKDRSTIDCIHCKFIHSSSHYPFIDTWYHCCFIGIIIHYQATMDIFMLMNNVLHALPM